MQSLLRFFIFFVTVLISLSNFGQKINSKWMLTKDVTDSSLPSINIFEFKNDMLYQYDFDKLIDSSMVVISKDKIKTEDSTFRYLFLNKDLLSITMPIINKDYLTTFKYVRVQPTKTSFEKKDIEKMIFNISWSNEEQKISFRKQEQEEIFKLEKNTDCEIVRLEKIDKTYFVSLFCYGKRRYVFPIKKITEKEMILCVPSRLERVYNLHLIRN